MWNETYNASNNSLLFENTFQAGRVNNEDKAYNTFDLQNKIFDISNVVNSYRTDNTIDIQQSSADQLLFVAQNWWTSEGRNMLHDNMPTDFTRDMITNVVREEKDDWLKVKKDEAAYHQYAGETGNTKYVNTRTGQEIVLDSNYNIVTDPKIYGTYNYGIAVQPKNNLDVIGWSEFIIGAPKHFLLDMVPYYMEREEPYYPKNPNATTNKN
jgi:hypothetical protein